jgi:hypothetical protein
MKLYFFIGFGGIEKITCSLLMTISYADCTVGIDVISVRETLLNFVRNIRETIKSFTTANYSLSIVFQKKSLQTNVLIF